MKWVSASILSLITGIAIGIGADVALLATSQDAIGAAAIATVLALPAGNTLGIVAYRILFVRALGRADILSSFLGFVLAVLASFVGLLCMDVFGAVAGLGMALVGSCASSLLGYAFGLSISSAR